MQSNIESLFSHSLSAAEKLSKMTNEFDLSDLVNLASEVQRQLAPEADAALACVAPSLRENGLFGPLSARLTVIVQAQVALQTLILQWKEVTKELVPNMTPAQLQQLTKSPADCRVALEAQVAAKVAVSAACQRALDLMPKLRGPYTIHDTDFNAYECALILGMVPTLPAVAALRVMVDRDWPFFDACVQLLGEKPALTWDGSSVLLRELTALVSRCRTAMLRMADGLFAGSLPAVDA